MERTDASAPVLLGREALALHKLLGVLLGIAIALKLTPAVFLLLFLLRKDLRAILVSTVSFACFSLIGHALMPLCLQIVLDRAAMGPFTYRTVDVRLQSIDNRGTRTTGADRSPSQDHLAGALCHDDSPDQLDRAAVGSAQ